MSTEAALAADARSPFEQLRFARSVILAESRALARIADRLDGEFPRAVELLLECRGNVIVSGIGKAGLVGQKIMATLASTGTPSHCLHPAEAMHGDLGRVQSNDVTLILSLSGETEEVVRLLPSLKEIGAPVVAITGSAKSTLGRAASAVIELGPIEEACPLQLAPSTSARPRCWPWATRWPLAVSRLRRFSREDFARFHPAGNLGFQLSKADQHMRPLAQCRVAGQRRTVREVLVGASVPGRRSGATMLVNEGGILSGIFTDSDLARLFEQHRDRGFGPRDRRCDDEKSATGRFGVADDRGSRVDGRPKNQRIARGRCRGPAAGDDRQYRHCTADAEGIVPRRAGGRDKQIDNMASRWRTRRPARCVV